MSSIVSIIDKQLNRYTMYRGLLFGLTGLLAIAVIFAYVGLVGISGTGLLVSIGILIAGSYVANYAFGTMFGAARNSESWLITALILACILPQATTLSKALYVLLAAIIAMASKYVLVYRGSHIFNPAAVAAFALTVTGLLPATWWIATPWLLPVTGLLALVTLRKQRNYPMFIIFTVAAVAMSIYVGTILHSQEFSGVLRNAFVSLPLVFLGSVMLTEPSTLPPTKYYQILLGALAGVFYASQLSVGSVSTTPEATLILAGLFSFAVAPAFGAVIKLREIRQLSPSIYELAFDKPKGLRFVPGQYMEWTLPHSKADFRGNRRSFSIASSPTEPELRIGIRTYEPSSSFKKALTGMQQGSLMRIAHVAGSFTLAKADQPLLLIAGGIGVTPFRSMLQHMIDTQEHRDAVLLYTAADAKDFVYKDVIKQAQSLGVVPHLTTERLNAVQIRKLVPDATNRQIYVSGPPGMVAGYTKLMTSLGVSRRNIHTDHFTGY